MDQRIYLNLNLICLVIASIISLLIPFLFKILPQKLPLFYSLPWGERILANSLQFFILPASIILITLINILISLNLHKSQSFFKTVLLISSFISASILVITFLKIIFIFL